MQVHDSWSELTLKQTINTVGWPCRWLPGCLQQRSPKAFEINGFIWQFFKEYVSRLNLDNIGENFQSRINL